MCHLEEKKSFTFKKKRINFARRNGLKLTITQTFWIVISYVAKMEKVFPSRPVVTNNDFQKCIFCVCQHDAIIDCLFYFGWLKK